MAHSLILGMTESGKTTFGKRLATNFRARNIKVLVLDPLNDPGWLADFKTKDPEEFLRVLWASRRCAAFIDEAGDMVGRYDALMQKTATRGRHWGHAMHYISQRGVQLSVTVRDQCSHLFLFTTAKKDAEIHANEWNEDALRDAHKLKQGDFFHATRFGTLERSNVFNGVNDNGTAHSARIPRRASEENESTTANGDTVGTDSEEEKSRGNATSTDS